MSKKFKVSLVAIMVCAMFVPIALQATSFDASLIVQPSENCALEETFDLFESAEFRAQLEEIILAEWTPRPVVFSLDIPVITSAELALREPTPSAIQRDEVRAAIVAIVLDNIANNATPTILFDGDELYSSIERLHDCNVSGCLFSHVDSIRVYTRLVFSDGSVIYLYSHTVLVLQCMMCGSISFS